MTTGMNEMIEKCHIYQALLLSPPPLPPPRVKKGKNILGYFPNEGTRSTPTALTKHSAASDSQGQVVKL